MKTIFTKHRLSLWILGGFLLLYLAIFIVNAILGIGPNLLMRWLGASENLHTFVSKTITYGLRLTAYILFPAWAIKRALHVNPWPGFFPLRRQLWKDVILGIVVILIVLTGLFVLEIQSGGLVVADWNWESQPIAAWWRTLWVGFLVNVCVAVGEETLFRGYLLPCLDVAWGRWKALLGMSVIFGLMHLLAYSEGGLQSATLALAILLATLFGILFGLARLYTGNLWMPVGMHFTWNFLEADLFNLTGDMQNPNLIGALARLQEPLTMSKIHLGNVVILELLAFAVISAVLLPWLVRRGKNRAL